MSEDQAPYGQPASVAAIDPGTEKSAIVVLDHAGGIAHKRISDNRCMLPLLRDIGGISGVRALAVEMVASYGMPVGRSTFETVLWAGRFIEAGDLPHTLVYRKDVKMHLCGSMRAKDGNIRQAIIDRYPAEGGGTVPQIGTKAKPGPLHGISSHLWAALAVALYWRDNYTE